MIHPIIEFVAALALIMGWILVTDEFYFRKVKVSRRERYEHFMMYDLLLAGSGASLPVVVLCVAVLIATVVEFYMVEKWVINNV